MSNKNLPYLHGFSEKEQLRLRKQARFAEHSVYQNIDFSREKNVIEVGSGVGAQTEILLRRFPNLKITCVDLNENQITSAKSYLSNMPHAQGRYNIQKMDAMNLDFDSQYFDGAFLCWILEHVPDPLRVLSEARRVLKPGSKIFLTEVMNHSFFLNPYSPNLWKYWMAFNDYQYDHAGDPFVGAKLGNLLSAVGFNQIRTEVKTWHFDNRYPAQRKETIEYWLELLMSAEDLLLKSGVVTQSVVDGARSELTSVQRDPNAVFFYSFMQAQATV